MSNVILISLCIITKNEEHNIARCLGSVQQLVDEMIIIDTGSEDNTAKIATEHGAKLFSFPWIDDFAAARNYGISKAQGHWILILDADEVLAPISRQKLLNFIEASPAEGYYFKICSYLNHGHEHTEDYVVRLFKNTPEYRFIGAIHEQIAGSIQSHNANGGLIFAPFTIDHYGYLLQEMESKHKFDRNTSLIKKTLIENPQDPFLHYCLGIEYLQNQNFEQAETLLHKTITLLRGDEGYIPQVLMGLLLVKLTEPEDPHAEGLFSRAIQTLPDNGDIFCLYGVWLMKHQRFSEATKVLEIALCKNGELIEHGRLTTLLGDAYCLAGMVTQAMECYTKALYGPSVDLYPLVRILTLWGRESSTVSLEPLWEKLTPEITQILLRRTLTVDRFDLALATILLAIIERTKANDIASMITGCSRYLEMLRAAIPVTPLSTHIYALLSLCAEELLLQSQLLQLSWDNWSNAPQALLHGAMANLLLVASLVQELSPTDPFKSWEEMFSYETCFDCQSC